MKKQEHEMFTHRLTGLEWLIIRMILPGLCLMMLFIVYFVVKNRLF